ncbi:MAG TPA: hypothetical protein DCS45_00640, partial [Roseovarius nubinhibens]|nr:hypothetical protein [Roseovarius nubinhibens]
MSEIVKLTGFKELDKELERLSKAAGKGVLRRSMIKAAEPMAQIARALAPNDPATGGFDLEASIKVGTRLSRSQKKAHRKMFRDDRAAVEVFMGAGPLPQAINQEFGNRRHGPQPFIRPSWDQDRGPLLDRLGQQLWSEIE